MVYDVIVVGAGPAGLAAGTNAAHRGLRTLILEGQDKAGGQPRQFYPQKIILDHPGFPDGVMGEVLSMRLYDQAVNSKAEIKLHEPVIEMLLDKEVKVIRTPKATYGARRVVLCTGLQNIPRRIDSLADSHDVHYYVKHPERFEGRDVVIIGGGDTAFDRANMLAPKARSVKVVVKGQYPKAKESSVALARSNNIEIFLDCEFLELKSEHKAAFINTTTKQEFELTFNDIIVAIGFVSNLTMYEQLGLAKENGHLKVDSNMETSIKGVFAAGDLVSEVKLIAVACSQGIVAAVKSFDSIRKPYWIEKP